VVGVDANLGALSGEQNRNSLSERSLFRSHEPIETSEPTDQMKAALIWNFWFWGALCVYASACIGAGLLLFRAVGSTFSPDARKSPLVTLALAFFLGLGALGQLWTLVALSGQLTLAVTGPVLGLLVAAALLLGRQHCAGLGDRLREALSELRGIPLGLQLVLAGSVGLLFYSFTSLGRDLSGDPLALHMMVAKGSAASGLLERHWFQAGNEYFGLVGEMTYAVLMQIGNEDAAQMVTWVVLFAIAAVLMGICTKLGLGLRGRIVALAMLVTTSAAMNWVGEGKIDLIATGLAVASLYFVVPRRDLSALAPGELMAGGLLAGFAVTAKLMLGFCVLVIGSILLFWTHAPPTIRSHQPWTALHPRRLMPLVLAGLLFGLFALIGMAPQFIKNGVLLGAPFAPLGTSFTGWLVVELWYDADTVRHIRMLYPLVLTFGEYFAQYGNLSVLVLAFVPLAVFLPRPASFWRSPLTAVTLAAWIAIALWAMFQGDKVVMRYILPALILCIPLAAASAERVTAPEFRSRPLRVLVPASCLAALCMTAFFVTNYWYFPTRAMKVASGTAGPCERGHYFCETMEIINQAAPAGARVFSALTYKYYFRPDIFQCAFDHRGENFPGSTSESRWRWFYAQGYSFILPDPAGNPVNLVNDLANPPVWVSIKRFQPDNSRGPLQIGYDLSKGGPSSPPTVACRETRPGTWRLVQTAPRVQ
jgi:hypothetical protein